MNCIVLYCIILYTNALCCTVLYMNSLYCTVLYCVLLHCIALYCLLYCIELYCINETIEFRFPSLVLSSLDFKFSSQNSFIDLLNYTKIDINLTKILGEMVSNNI